MIRKLIMVAAACAVPLGVVALGAGQASAKGSPPPSPPLNCSASGTVTFASPGISNYGSASPSKISTTTTSPITYSGAPANCGSGGSGPANNINSKSTLKCNKKVSGEDANGATRPACVPGDYVYDSAGQFASAGVATIQKALKHLSFTVNGITFAGKTTSASVSQSGQCPGEIGFDVSGTVKAKPFTYSQFSLVACLGNDSGPGTTGSFLADISAAIGGNNSVTIQSATLDGSPGESTLSIS